MQLEKIRQEQDAKDYSQIDESTFAIDQLLSLFHFALKLGDQEARSEKASSTKESVKYSRMASQSYRLKKKEASGSPLPAVQAGRLQRKATGGGEQRRQRKKSLDMGLHKFVEAQETPELTDNSKQRGLKQVTYLGSVRATEECNPLKMSGRLGLSTEANLVLNQLTEKASLKQASQKPASRKSALIATYFVGILKSLARVACTDPEDAFPVEEARPEEEPPARLCLFEEHQQQAQGRRRPLDGRVFELGGQPRLLQRGERVAEQGQAHLEHLCFALSLLAVPAAVRLDADRLEQQDKPLHQRTEQELQSNNELLRS